MKSYLFDSYIMTVMSGVDRTAHRHAAYQLTVSLDGRPHGVGTSPRDVRPGLIHLVGSGVSHAFDGAIGEQALFWLAPDGTLGRRLAHTYLRGADIVALPDSVVASLPIEELANVLHGAGAAAEVRRRTDRLLSTLGEWTAPPAEAVHPAVRKAVRVIRALEVKQISADELASRVGLSRGRLLHVFKEHMGIPLRPYLQWLRCLEAMALIADGHSVTDAALAAGFVDGAHCNRVIKRYVCLSPSVLGGTQLHVERCLTEMPR